MPNPLTDYQTRAASALVDHLRWPDHRAQAFAEQMSEAEQIEVLDTVRTWEPPVTMLLLIVYRVDCRIRGPRRAQAAANSEHRAQEVRLGPIAAAQQRPARQAFDPAVFVDPYHARKNNINQVE